MRSWQLIYEANSFLVLTLCIAELDSNTNKNQQHAENFVNLHEVTEWRHRHFLLQAMKVANMAKR
jgi:hypothetical protein